MKIKAVIAAAAAVGLCASAFCQTVKSNSKSETTVESEYLSNVEDVIISELSMSEDYDSKMVALQYLESSIEDGRASPEMQHALDSLSGEGTNTVARTKGRLSNNYPDIRAKACELLGRMPTTESTNTLINVVKADTEPMVLSAAVRSLGEIGLNPRNEVIETIALAQRKNAALNPTISFAYEVLVTYEKLPPLTEDKSLMIQSLSTIASNGRYVTPVRTKALQVLKNLQGSGKGGKAAEK